MLVNQRPLTRREEIQAIEYLTEAGSWDRQFLWATRNSETTKKQLNEVFFLLAGLAMLGSVFGALYLGAKFLDKYDFSGKGVKPEDESTLKKSITDLMGKHKGLNDKAIKELRKKMEDMGLEKEQIDAIIADLQKESSAQREKNGKELGALNAWLAENPPEEKGWKTKFTKWVTKNMKSVGLQVGIGEETWTISGEEDVSELKDRIPDLRKEFINQGVKIPEGWAETLETFYEEFDLPKLVTLEELEADANSSSQVAEGAVIYRTGRRQFDLMIENTINLIMEESDTSEKVLDAVKYGWDFSQAVTTGGMSLLPTLIDRVDAQWKQMDDDSTNAEEIVNDVNDQLEDLKIEEIIPEPPSDEEERKEVYERIRKEFQTTYPDDKEGSYFIYDTTDYNKLVNDIESDEEYKPFLELLKLYGLRNITLSDEYKENTKDIIKHATAVTLWNEKVREAFGAKKKEQDDANAAEEASEKEQAQAQAIADALDPDKEDNDDLLSSIVGGSADIGSSILGGVKSALSGGGDLLSWLWNKFGKEKGGRAFCFSIVKQCMALVGSEIVTGGLSTPVVLGLATTIIPTALSAAEKADPSWSLVGGADDLIQEMAGEFGAKTEPLEKEKFMSYLKDHGADISPETKELITQMTKHFKSNVGGALNASRKILDLCRGDNLSAKIVVKSFLEHITVENLPDVSVSIWGTMEKLVGPETVQEAFKNYMESQKIKIDGQTDKSPEAQNSSYDREGNVIFERWGRLAGLL